MSGFRVGDRVRLRAEVDLFPTGVFPAGLLGCVSQYDERVRDVVMHVRLDQQFACLNEWANELQVWRDGTDESVCTLGCFEIVERAPLGPLTIEATCARFRTGERKRFPGIEAARDWMLGDEVQADDEPEMWAMLRNVGVLFEWGDVSYIRPPLNAPLPDIAVEFRDFDVSTMPGEIPAGFEASHWHNEACPSWSHPDLGLQVWIDYADVTMREFPDGRRFTLEYMPGDVDDSRRMVLAWSDDWAVVLATLRDLDASMIASKWVKRFGLGFHPDTRGVDYVDAAGVRCLSDVEAAEYEVDIDTLHGLCDPYEAGLRAMDAAGLNIQ